MANLTRYKQKIFANNSNQVGVFGTGTDKVASKNVETLQSADYEDGWSSAIVTNKNYPVWQERDGVDYGFSYQLAYLLQKGIPEWLSTETYYQNDYCKVGNAIYYSLQDNNVGHNPSNTSGYWSIFASSSRNIGEIVPSTIPLTDAGLHLLDGALLSASGSYTDFVEYIGDLYDSGNYAQLFDTEVNWQASDTTYGVCGKFVYDSVNNTVRLPKITGFIEGGEVLTVGDLVEAGLPNITGKFANKDLPDSTNGQYTCFTDVSGAFAIDKTGKSSFNGAGSGSNGNSLKMDASYSSSIYGNSNTVQPQAVKVLYYIVVATTTKTDIQVDIDEIATDLNGKMDVDLSNCTKPYVTTTYVNGSSWYRVYSDKWCEQGGIIAKSTSTTQYQVALLQNYADSTYCVQVTDAWDAVNSSNATTNIKVKTTSSFTVFLQNLASTYGASWYACGYIS